MYLTAVTAVVVVAAAAWYSTDGLAARGGEQRNSQLPAANLDARTRLDLCGTKATPADQLGLIEQTLAATADNGGLVIVPVYWHVIINKKGQGDVSALVPAQMRGLNDAYAGSSFAFELKSVQLIQNDAWYFARSVGN